MAKHDRLTEEEFANYKPPARMIDQLGQYCQSRGLHASQVRVLDWGCGRGRTVLWLLEQGYQAYGVDIDPEPINNGLVLFREKRHPDSLLSLFSPEGRTIYEDGFFDFVMTNNVLEHVSSLDQVATEIGRLTSKRGAGYHIFPAQRQFIEGHLFMPVIHWLPEGGLRKGLIRLCVRLGKHPKWAEVEGKGLTEMVNVYYRYSTDHIFYRPFKQIKSRFEAQGFSVTFLTINNPAISKNNLLGPLLKNKLTRPIINWLVLTFKQVEMLTTKIK
jgi:SAM-dependent methyltransferase